MSRVKFTTTIDRQIYQKFRNIYKGSIGSLIDGIMLVYIREKEAAST